MLLIDNDPLYRGGVNSYLHGLLSGFAKEDKKNSYSLLVYKKNSKFYKQYVSKNFKLVILDDENKWFRQLKIAILLIFSAPVLRIFYMTLERILYASMIEKIDGLIFDVLYSPSAPHFPLSIKGKIIVSPHDMQHVHYPENFSLIEKWRRDTTYALSTHLSYLVQASTIFNKKDFHATLGIPIKKIVVIPQGVMDKFLKFKPVKKEDLSFLKKYRLNSGYIFYPAQHWRHKNHITLLKSLIYLKDRYSLNINAVFTGAKQARFRFLYNFVEANDLQYNVKFLGNIKFSEILYAYFNSSIVVIPVVYESASLPIKEAMAVGKPVIASRNGSNQEINEKNNIILFDTYDYVELAEKIRNLLKDKCLQNQLVKKSRKMVKNYSWQKIARLYLNIFDSIK